MGRLHGSASLMVVSDLDYTMVDHDDPGDLSFLSFNALWDSYYRHDSLLVFSTRRSPTSYKLLRNEKHLLTPDVDLMSVETEFAYGELMVPDLLNNKWDRRIIIEETSKYLERVPQSDIDQRPHKVSFYVEKVKALEIIDILSKRLEKRGLDVKIIYSSRAALDVFPGGTDKGQTLAYLSKFAFDGKLLVDTRVYGDSGNDAKLFTVPEAYGVMVSYVKKELLQWYEENTKNNPNILQANERCAVGIIQAIGNFGLGPKVSPRDIKDFQKCKVEITKPVKGHIFVHPSGFEQPIHQCIDAMKRLHRDRQVEHFWVWVDQVSSAQISSGAWLVYLTICVVLCLMPFHYTCRVYWENKGRRKIGRLSSTLDKALNALTYHRSATFNVQQLWFVKPEESSPNGKDKLAAEKPPHTKGTQERKVSIKLAESSDVHPTWSTRPTSTPEEASGMLTWHPFIGQQPAMSAKQPVVACQVDNDVKVG
ncbi:hypothetical protein FNV43_RR09698 [Rhamnella rubrinervis]|uniref:Sucrose-phosphatase n=1 Tax=Rhamnella rubrinervis TaxID=2594499 RepID=A0A8K0HB68_9ROSA|nr:hypothetical protein FNV43_RR09698 [Rhamnella rubrinervis]